MEVTIFVTKDFEPMNVMCERAGMFESLLKQRT